MVLTHDRHTPGFDVSLVGRACAGDYEAFTTLMQRHADSVRRLVRRFVRDGDDARDVEQDTWIRAANNLDSLVDAERFQPWVKAIARNASLDYLSSRKRRGAHVTTFEVLGTEDFEDKASPTPEAAVLSRDSQQKVWQALGTLSDRDRTALFLREYKGLPYSDVAAELGISRNAAEVCAHRARTRFREAFTAVDAGIPECGVDGFRLSTLLDPAEGGPLTARLELESHLDSCGDCQRRLTAMNEGRTLYRNLGVFGLPIPGAGLVGWAGGLLAKLGQLLGLTAGGGAATAAAGASTTAAATAGATVAATGVAGAISATAVATTAATVIFISAVMPSVGAPAIADTGAPAASPVVAPAVIQSTPVAEDTSRDPVAPQVVREPHEDEPAPGPIAVPAAALPIVPPDDEGDPAPPPTSPQDAPPLQAAPVVSSVPGPAGDRDADGAAPAVATPPPSSDESAAPPSADVEDAPRKGQGPPAHSKGSAGRSNSEDGLAPPGPSIVLVAMTPGSPGKGPNGTGTASKGANGTSPAGKGSNGTGPADKGPNGTGPSGKGPNGDGPPGKGPNGDGPPGVGPTAVVVLVGVGEQLTSAVLSGTQSGGGQGNGPSGGGPPGQATQGNGPSGDGPPTQTAQGNSPGANGPPVQATLGNAPGGGGPPGQAAQDKSPRGHGPAGK